VLTLYALILPFAAALVAPLLVRAMGNRAAWVLALAPLALFIHFWSILASAPSLPVVGGVDWAPALGLRLSWLLDGLSLTFALLICGIGVLIVLYSGEYLKGHPRQGSFLSFILIFMGAMQGLVLSDSFLMLFVFWELTSIASFLLIGFDHEREAARRAALQALVVTGLGGLSLLAGLLLVQVAIGADSLSSLAGTGNAMRGNALYAPALILVLGGAFTKSAQVPFNFWLPNAMQAPTPVSAYLHSATMVKAGVYLLMRLNPSFGDTALWETLLPLFGAVTLVTGAVLAMRQTDMKLMLAQTTVASLGLLVMLTGLGSDLAVEAAVLYLVAHSMFKGGLFMVAGAMDHGAGTRDVTRLSGLARAMPLTCVAAGLAGLSMAGIPLFFGFIAKEVIYVALAPEAPWPALLLVCAVLGNALMVAVALMVGLRPFIAGRSDAGSAHDGPTLLLAGPVLLGAAGLALALFSDWFHERISTPLATAVAGTPLEVHASALPHFGIPLLLSALTVMLGAIAFLARGRLRVWIAATLEAVGWGPDRGFDQVMVNLVRLATRITAIVQSGRLDIYLLVTFIALACATLVPMIAFGELPSIPAWPGLLPHEWFVLALAVLGIFAVIRPRDRLTAIVSLGIQGFAVALLFLLFGAPDLSFTQFMIETLSVVILALVMTRLHLVPTDRRTFGLKLRDGVVAIACGLGAGLLLLKVVQLPFDDRLTQFFNTYSLALAHGRNIVNVIIVDFRGLDTLGEISVVMIAGLAILALIRIAKKPSPAGEG